MNKKTLLFALVLIVVSNQSLAQQYTNGSMTLMANLLVWKLREGSTDNWGQIIASSGENQPVER